MKKIKISVIIPIYKVEKYLKQCVDSVLNQTYKNIEIILVDDGSPDQCPVICDQYKKQDNRVVVLHKKNGGLSDARNYGVKYATGDYGVFLDSDDYWTEKNALKILTERLEKKESDIINFAYHKYAEDTGTCFRTFSDIESMSIREEKKYFQLKYLFDNSLYIASACNKLIKIDLLKQIKFVCGKLSEDIEWCARLLETANSIDFIDLDMYCYRQRVESITHTIGRKNCIDLKDAILSCITIEEECKNDSQYFLGRYAAYQFSTFIAVQAYSDEYPVECIKELGLKKDILKFYGNNRKVKYMYYGSKILGLNLWCKIIRFMKPIWGNRRNIV